MKKIIKLTESDLSQIVKKVLQEQGSMFGTAGSDIPGYRSYDSRNQNKEEKKEKSYVVDINPKKLKLGSGGLKNPKQVEDVKKLQSELIKLGFLKLKKGPTGYFGPITQKALDDYNQSTGRKKDNTTKVEGGSYPCVGLTKDKCARVSSKSSVEMGSAGTDECASYVTKCLSEYDRDFKTGNAWVAASWAKGQGGKEKFNLFTSQIDWNKIWNDLKKNQITKNECMGFYGKSKSDLFTFSGKKKKLLEIVLNSVPPSSKLSISQLKPGDIVGLWHKNTNNKGRAFCERMVNDLKLDEKGNFKELPFTYNTHVGFVTTVKDGVPIIAHNVSGTYYTVPATQMLSSDSDDMITWVITDPQVESELARRTNKTQLPSFSNYKLDT